MDVKLYKPCFSSVGPDCTIFFPMHTLTYTSLTSVTCTMHNQMSCKHPKYAKQAKLVLGFNFVKRLSPLPCTSGMVQTACNRGWFTSCFHTDKYSAISLFKPMLLAALSNSIVLSKMGSLEYSTASLIRKFLALGLAFWCFSIWSIYKEKLKTSHRVKSFPANKSGTTAFYFSDAVFLFIFIFQFVLQMCLLIVMKIIVLRDLCAKQSVNGLFANIKVKKKIGYQFSWYWILYFFMLLLSAWKMSCST